MDEKGLIDKFIEYRRTRRVAEFARELLNYEFCAEKLARDAIERNQGNALGYFCEVMLGALNDRGLDTKTFRLCYIVDKLSKVQKKWQFLYENIEDVVKSILKGRVTDRNARWQVYTELDENMLRQYVAGHQ
ncbi:hypothetical protein KY311_02175 [Candidatus Woesearchaeota archaeon]|nr:hypothetical protein [Candidatus Woesearchaeota archaeon]